MPTKIVINRLRRSHSLILYRTYAKLHQVGAIHVALADRRVLPLLNNQG
ncbi:MAG: hypothetical protein ACYTXA_23550 [Nostoc sp.]